MTSRLTSTSIAADAIPECVSIAEYFERGTFVKAGKQLGYRCTGNARLRETRAAYFIRFTGESCYEYDL